jgi:asparagine synthase (glutamine-hydrolysing)
VCGLVGFAGESTTGERALAAMRDTLRHRGPDGSGLHLSSDGWAGLGFCRLSVIDLSAAGDQPLRNEDGTVHVTVNGEIYNYRALRRELLERGHRLRSASDAEVVVHLWEELGPELVHRLDGMFALAVIDERRGSVLLARDRLGIKPLYYRWDGRTLLFASEARAVLAHPDVQRRVDPGALADYLSYGYVPLDRCIFEGLRKLPAGHLLVLDRQTSAVSVRPYWDVEYSGEVTDETTAAAELTSLLENAVSSHMVADVPIGVFLSGGLDSSTVLSFASETTDQSLRAFSMEFDVERRNETRYARIAADAFGAELQTHRVSIDDAEASLSSLVEIYDEPFYDASGIPTQLLSRAARRSVKVALAGDGGDELLGGYPRYWETMRAEARWRSRPGLLRAGGSIAPAAARSVRRMPYLARAVNWTRALEPSPEERYFRLVGFLDPWEQRRALGPDLKRVLDGYDHLWLLRRFHRADHPPAAAVRYIDLKTYLTDDILTKVDRASMHHSLEIRPPLLDHRLVEFAFRLHPSLLLDGDGGKQLLRHAMAEHLPREILERGKQGFSVPLRDWMRGQLGMDLRRNVRSWRIVHDGLIRAEFVEWLIASRSYNRWAKLWLLAALEKWYGRWII